MTSPITKRIDDDAGQGPRRNPRKAKEVDLELAIAFSKVGWGRCMTPLELVLVDICSDDVRFDKLKRCTYYDAIVTDRCVVRRSVYLCDCDGRFEVIMAREIVFMFTNAEKKYPMLRAHVTPETNVLSG